MSDVPYAGQIVHVTSPGFCRVGLVLASGKPGGSSRVRVFVQGIVEAGRDDFEGDFRHATHPISVPNPPGSPQPFRTLDTWHRIEDCSNGA